MAQGRVSVLARVASSLLGAVLASSCSNDAPLVSETSPPDFPARDSGGKRPTEDAAAPSPPECDVPNYPDESDSVPFERLEARVVDEGGRPVAGTTAQACGLDLCLFGDTDGVGRIVHTERAELRKVAFKYGDGVRHAQLALLLGAGPRHELGDQITLTLPDLGSGSALVPGTTLESSGVELTLDPTTTITMDLALEDEEEVFLAEEFPREAFPSVAADQDFVAMFALGPPKTKLCPPARLRLPNSTGLSAGSRVSVVLHGIDPVAYTHAPYGGWAEVSTATVSEDGAFIETEPTEGLPMLSVIGIR